MRDLLVVSQQGGVSPDPWKSYTLAEEVIARYAGTPQEGMVTQHAGHVALSALVQSNDLRSEHVEAIALHTERLLERNHPHLPLIRDGLARLDDHWPADRRATAIALAHASAADWLDKNPCETCLGEGVDVAALASARDRTIARMNAAIPEAVQRLERVQAEL